jgi:hypothetical protein
MDGHQSSKCHDLEISDLVDLREIVEPYLEVAVFSILMP